MTEGTSANRSEGRSTGASAGGNFVLRAPLESDRHRLEHFLNSESLGLPDAWMDGQMAVTPESDELVGYIYIAQYGGDAYVAPIAVVEGWRKKGVGATLIAWAFQEHEELRLVSEGRAHGFYHALGFQHLPWEQVDAYPRSLCEQCPDLETCHPQPFIGTRDGTACPAVL